MSVTRSALFSSLALQSVPPNRTMKPPFRHKNIRLPLDRYPGTGWFFITFCCENRNKIFLDPTRAQWLLDNLRQDAPSTRSQFMPTA
jgi:hypothetical protein